MCTIFIVCTKIVGSGTWNRETAARSGGARVEVKASANDWKAAISNPAGGPERLKLDWRGPLQVTLFEPGR